MRLNITNWILLCVTAGVCGGASMALGDGCIPAPTDVNAEDHTHCNPVNVVWLDHGGTSFRVMRAPADDPGAAEALETVASPVFYDYTATPGRVYLYWVVAIAECGESDPSAPDAGGSGLGGILPPAWVFASDNQYCDLIVVDWDQSNGGYWDLYRGESPDFEAAGVLESNVYPPYNDYGVAGNVGYYYWVVPNTGCGPGGNPGGPDIGYSNYGLYITGQPEDQFVRAGEAASFHVGVSGFGAYQWFRDGEQLFDGGAISGVNSETLRIDPVWTSDAGDYSCEVYGGCGSRTSDSAHLYIESGSCPADFNRDGGVDGADVEAFFGAWERGEASGDVNGDGGIDGGDVETFFVAWEAGGCG